MSFAQKPLVFLRVSSPDQYLTNQRYEVSSFLKKRQITDAVYMEMTGSAFRRVHPTMYDTVVSMLNIDSVERPSFLVFAAVDRVSRNYEHGVNFMEMVRSMNIPVLFVRTPNVDIRTTEGWAYMLELLKASEIEAQNLSARAKAAWELRRNPDSGAQKRDRDSMVDDNQPPAKRAYPSSLYSYANLNDDEKAEYYCDLLYILYLLGHENVTLGSVLAQIKYVHIKYAPELCVQEYGLRIGKRRLSLEEVFVGNDEDFANILNSYNLSPVAPNMHDRWSAENIDDVFTNVIEKIPNLDTTVKVLLCHKFIELVKDIRPHYLPPLKAAV